LHLGGAREYLNINPLSQTQFYIQSGNLPANAGLPRFTVLNWAQTNPSDYQPGWGAGPYIMRQTLPSHMYARSLSGVPFLNVFGRRLWSWQAAQNPFDTRLDTLDRDGYTARYYLSLVNALVPHPIAMVGENDEALGAMPGTWMAAPPLGDQSMFQDRNLSFPGITIDGYQGRRGLDFRRRYSDRFRHYQDSLQVDSLQLYWYNAGGSIGISHYLYDSARYINRFSDGVLRGTDYWYPQFPARWRYGTNGVTGFQELLPGRLNEILAGDRRFMPAVSPGFNEQGGTWISNDRAMLRPGQFLGSLKALGVMGADGYALFMTHGISTTLVPMQGSWRAWHPAIPAYAQAVTDRMGNLLAGGYLLDGDNVSGPGSLF
ncbi:MAG TPA: hypothetical protein PKW90_26440, partial [Myxococcota bacterium]|nr:hypothetical protein [Myxococcota bacterium]